MIKNILLTALSSAVLFTSCMDSFLDTESPSVPSNQNVFESTALTEAALMGVYATMTDTYMYGQKLCVNWQGASDVEVGSNAFNTGNYNTTTGDQGAMNFYDDSYNNTTQWNVLYKYVEMATTAVDGIRQSSLLQGGEDQSTMRAYLGEALALKALGYFELVCYWGDVPFKETSSSSDLANVYKAKVDRDTIYNHIINDLKEAIEYLPWVGEGAYTAERMNKGFAKGLLARVALFAGGWSVRDGNTFPDLDLEHHPRIPEMNGYFVGRPKNWEEYYKLAAQQCAEILGASDNPHGLDPSFEHIWEQVNGLEANSYNENLFEVAFGEGQNGDVGATMGYSLDRGVFNASRGMGGSGYAATTMYYFYSFDKADLRRDVTCCFQQYRMEEAKAKEVLRCDPLGVACGKWRWYWMTDEYMKNRFPEAQSRIATGINWILMRYSDIYLMFAEAQNQIAGNPDAVNEVAGMSARDALLAVRNRAFGAGSPEVENYDKGDFFNAIVNERAWEFGCENIRKQDLVRWGLLDEKIEAMKVALVQMYDNQDFKAFDKEYRADEFPKKLYYQYEDPENEEYIDLSTVNFYEDQGTGDAKKGWYAVNWVPMLVTLDKEGEVNAEINKNYVETIAKILVCGTGLMGHYDYSELFNTLHWGNEAQSGFAKYAVGNGVCNYRHLFAIYYEDIFESQGKLVNSYGYK